MKRIKERIDEVLNTEIRSVLGRLSPKHRLAVAAAIFFTLFSGYGITIGYGLYRIGRDDAAYRLSEMPRISIPYCADTDSVRISNDVPSDDDSSCVNNNEYDENKERQ